MTPHVSVVIPAFNAHRTLGDQLSALARQRPDFEWEILVCDNGSTDGTARLVRSWMSVLPALSLIDASARRGPSAARNIGAEAARSAFLLFCDADDVVADDWVVEMRDALRSSAIVAGANDYLRMHSRLHLAISRSEDSLITMPYWPRFPSAGSGNLGIDSAVFSQVGGFDETLGTGEDVDLCWRVQLAGHSLVRRESAVVFVRKRRGIAPVFRQAYSYAAGHQVLRRKYAREIDDYWLERAAVATIDHDLAGGPRTRRLSVRRLIRLFRPNGLADLAWLIGERLGAHRGI